MHYEDELIQKQTSLHCFMKNKENKKKLLRLLSYQDIDA